MLTMHEFNSLPKNVRYQRQVLANTKNAIGAWRKAIALFPSEPDPAAAASYLLYGPEDAGAAVPTSEDYENLAADCRKYESCFSAIDEGLDRGSLQFPATNGFGESWDHILDLISGLRKISSARTIKVMLHQRNGELRVAVDELVKLYRLGQLICNGDGVTVCYLTGSGIRSSALSLFNNIIESSPSDLATLKPIHDTLVRASQEPDGIVQASRAELVQFGIPTIERIPETNNYEQLVDYLLEQFYGTSLISDFDDSQENVSQQVRDERQSLRKEQLNRLLSGHPKAFDRAETIRMLVQATSRYISRLEFVMKNPNSRWRHRLRDIVSKWDRAKLCADANRIWPESLSPSFPFELFGEDDAAEASRKEFSCSANAEYPPAWRPLSQSDLADRNQLLRRVVNPVGKILAVQQIAFDASSCCFEHYRCLHAAIRTLARQI